MSETNSPSDWIYILLTLLTAGLSMLKSLSKNNKKTTAQKKRIDEFSEDNRENTITNEHTNNKEEIIPEYSSNPQKESKTKEALLKPLVNEDQDTTPEDNDFDLKKAVIYNEILNKKYE